MKNERGWARWTLLAVGTMFVSVIFLIFCAISSGEEKKLPTILEEAKQMALTGQPYEYGGCEIWELRIGKNLFVSYCQKHGTIYMIKAEAPHTRVLVYQNGQFYIGYFYYNRLIVKKLIEAETGIELAQEFMKMVKKSTGMREIQI